ncbi:hypothetical protein GCM10010442_02780 [Kitasatospora kifunensis]
MDGGKHPPLWTTPPWAQLVRIAGQMCDRGPGLVDRQLVQAFPGAADFTHSVGVAPGSAGAPGLPGLLDFLGRALTGQPAQEHWERREMSETPKGPVGRTSVRGPPDRPLKGPAGLSS